MVKLHSICGVSLLLFGAYSMADVNYQMAITQPEHHLSDIRVEFPATAQSFLDVKLPAWRTGRYEILDMANGVRLFNANDKNGHPLKWEKIEKSTWRIHLDQPTEVSLNYQVYANELGYRSRHIDDSHAFIDASGFFMYSDSFRQEPVTVNLSVPKKWRSVSGMSSGRSAHQFVAANYDVLVDSPIETGINQWHEFEVDGRQYELVIWGHGNYDVELMLSDLKKLVKTGTEIWHAYPYERYVFMVHATSGARGATEHLNSTIIQRHRESFEKRDDYLGFISTAAHEFIHTWNVKAYRPAGMVPYDYINPNYTKLLWLAEGSTSYFEEHLLLRAEIMTQQEMFKQMAKSINRHLATPGRTIQSAAETSFDKWINQGGDHGRNYSTNIYSEGALVSFALDIDILKRTNGKKSYRDVHQLLYKNFALPKGFTEHDVIDILNSLTGADYSTWWQAHITEPAQIDFDLLLNEIGLELVYPKGHSMVADPQMSFKSGSELSTLTAVQRNGAAWQAGLTTDDIIVAINGQKAPADLKGYFTQYQAGETVKVDFFRRDTLMSTTLTFAEKSDKDKVVQVVTDPTEQQKALYKAWIGHSLIK